MIKWQIAVRGNKPKGFKDSTNFLTSLTVNFSRRIQLHRTGYSLFLRTASKPRADMEIREKARYIDFYVA
jgi:hypothetical protein